MPEFLERDLFDLAYAFVRDIETRTELFERQGRALEQAEAMNDDIAFAITEGIENIRDRLGEQV